MTYQLTWLRRCAGSVLVALLWPAAAFAQNAPTTPSQGPLVVERVRSPLVVAPDYKVTDLDGEFGQLAGFYAGRLIEDTLFIGGAGYWLVDGSGGDRLAYGGVLAGWSMPAARRIRFGVRTLAGIGTGTLGTDLERGVRPVGFDGGRNLVRFGSVNRSTTTTPGTIRVRVRDDFVVLEPQADVLIRLTDHIGLHWAAGYRLTGLADALEDRLDGATGGVAVQFEW